MDTKEGATSGARVFDVGFTDNLPAWENTVLAVQNILGMTGMFLFPAILGLSFHLRPVQTAELYGATFVTCGLVSVLQGLFILRMPIVMGPWAGTFAALLAGGHIAGLGVAFGSLFVAALIWVLLSIPVRRGALVGYTAALFRDPIVYAGILIITMASLSNITLANWIGTPAQPGFGAGNWIGGAVCVVAIIVAFVYGRGLLRRGAMLWGIVVGTVAFALFAPIRLQVVGAAPWVYTPQVFPFGFGVSPILVLLFFLMMMTGAASALSQYQMVAVWAQEQVDTRRMTAGVFTQSIGGAFAAVVGAFSTNAYPDCLGILKTSRVGSVRVTVTAGAILLVLGFSLKFDALFVAIPGNVIAAAATLMFGIVLAAGIEMLGRVEWDQINSIVIGLSFMVSIGGMFLSPATLRAYPLLATSVLEQPILTGSVLLVVLHLVLNVWLRPRLAARAAAVAATAGSR